jgi:hypothetical protein
VETVDVHIGTIEESSVARIRKSTFDFPYIMREVVRRTKVTMSLLVNGKISTVIYCYMVIVTK